ncbi:uncharacterized protein LOC107273612 isoform X2 [Cephus cinctus]|uniref:inositol-pentakisphosphate 2-kinase n=1 Tax=Cephus cinctus TaxID=211228 RepID=A0AAJ7RTA0_CEPCN|nr:uncharacterized protein LOC107273612 isoform X2 [Cephus cinctus]
MGTSVLSCILQTRYSCFSYRSGSIVAHNTGVMILDEGITSTATCISSMKSELSTSISGNPPVHSWPTSGILPLTRASFEGCLYRGEGNANVVIALPRERKVVRFRKSSPGEVSPDAGRARVEREVDFLRSVISGFLGCYVQTPYILRGNQDDMAALSEAIYAFRPEYRRNKEIVEEYATKFPDYTFLPPSFDTPEAHSDEPAKYTFCVEIKPKQGFLHDQECQFKKCPYCLTQYYKLKNGTVSQRSRYCPLDLFSGDNDRMQNALRGLLESPQNNLKIFKDGIIVYSQDSCPDDIEHIFADWFPSSTPCTPEQYFNKFSSLVIATLLRSFPQNLQSVIESHPHVEPCDDLDPPSRMNLEIVAKAKKILYFAGEECNFTTGHLPPDSVLGRILCMQQLPYCSADIVYRIYSKYRAVLNDEVIYSNIIEMHRNEMESREHVASHKRKAHLYLTQSDNVKRSMEDTNELYTRNLSLCKIKLQDTNGNRRNETHCCHWIFNNDSNIKEEKKLDLATNSVSLINKRNSVIRQKRKIDVKTSNNPLSIEQLRVLQNYLLFSTARDCSILMAFREFDPNTSSNVPSDHVIKISEGLHYLANVGVSDLDPKSVRCIEKHRLRDVDILNAVIQVLEEELALRNQGSLEGHKQHISKCSD